MNEYKLFCIIVLLSILDGILNIFILKALGYSIS